jgi:adenylyltransferase/sulfurtransferase
VTGGPVPSARVDVRDFTCPITWVKTRIALERLQLGDVLEVLLHEGEPLRNLPGSAAEEGHRVLVAEPLHDERPGSWRILLERGAAPLPGPAGGKAELDAERIARWARQLLVPGFGAAGQERLMAARVRVVGAAGPATPALVALAQAGVGTIWIDDPEPVGPCDLAGWLYHPEEAGRPRASVAAAAIAKISRFVSALQYPVGGAPSAALICASLATHGLEAAEVARRARIPHVVLELDGEAGQLVSVPPGAPCFACARFTAAGGHPPLPGALALASLAAQEMLRLVVEPNEREGRRFDLVRGLPSVRPTRRLPGCACGQEESPVGP